MPISKNYKQVNIELQTSRGLCLITLDEET